MTAEVAPVRAEFNVTAELWSGPTAAIPNVLLASFPARLVGDSLELLQTYPYRNRRRYLTCEYPLGKAANVTTAGPVAFYIIGSGDRVAIPAIAFPLTDVLLVETVVPREGTPYVRYHLGNYEFPPFIEP